MLGLVYYWTFTKLGDREGTTAALANSGRPRRIVSSWHGICPKPESLFDFRLTKAHGGSCSSDSIGNMIGQMYMSYLAAKTRVKIGCTEPTSVQAYLAASVTKLPDTHA